MIELIECWVVCLNVFLCKSGRGITVMLQDVKSFKGDLDVGCIISTISIIGVLLELSDAK